MFNHLTPAEVVIAIGRAARDAARGNAEASEFSRGQLLSAYSCARHLAVELGFGADVRACAADVDAILRDANAGPLEVTDDGGRLGPLLCDALDRLRADTSLAASEARTQIQARLRALADREVELLAAVIERTPKA